MKRKLPKELQSYVHAGATSADILDTAQSLKIRDAVRKVLLPELLKLFGFLIDFTSREASYPAGWKDSWPACRSDYRRFLDGRIRRTFRASQFRKSKINHGIFAGNCPAPRVLTMRHRS